MSKDAARAALKATPPGLRAIMRFLLIRPLRTHFRYAPCSWGKRALWDHIADHLWWLESRVKAKTLSGSTLHVDAGDIVGKYIYYFGVWEPNLTSWIQQRLKPGDVFIDVGANIGYYTLLASKLVGDSGKVVAVEALPQIFRRLEDNLKMNSARNVRSVNAAAWHRDEQVTIFTDPENPPGTTTLIQEWATQWHLQTHCKVPAKPLSIILTPDEIKACRLMKVDVEGAEWNVVSGMKPLVPAFRPDLEIMVEISRSMLAVQGKTNQDILDLFSVWGFHAYCVENDYSAAAYFTRTAPIRPKRIAQIPCESRDQIDLIFSRVDVPHL